MMGKKKRGRSRLLSCVLAICMVITLMPTVSAAAAADYTDVSSGDWYYDSVKYVSEHKYFEGTGGGAFSPNAPMTRAMFVTVLSRLAGAATSDDISPFSDVAQGAWYAGEVAWAAENKLASGTGGGAFSPEKSVTRQDMAAFMARYIEYYTEKNNVTLAAAETAKTFADAGSIAAYAKDAVALCSSYGLIDGYPDGSFAPADTASRAQVAAVIHRLALLLEGAAPVAESEADSAGGSGGGGGSHSRDTSSEGTALTATDFQEAAQAESTIVTATILDGNYLTVNDDVTVTNNYARELTLDLGSANLGDLTINAKYAEIITLTGNGATVTSLTVDTPEASVTDAVTVNGSVNIKAVSAGTFNVDANVTTGDITISGPGAINDARETPAQIVVDTTETVIVRGNSTAINVVADGAQLTVDTKQAPTIESSAANVALTVETEAPVTVGGTIQTITTKTESPKLTVDGTVEDVKIEAKGSTAPKLELTGTGSISAMDTGKADVTIKADETQGDAKSTALSVEKVTASGGSITAPANTVSKVEVAENAELELNAQVETVEAKAEAKLTLAKDAVVKTLEAEGNLTLGGSGEVTSVDVQAASANENIEIKVESSSLEIVQVTKTADTTGVVDITGQIEEKPKVLTKAARPESVEGKAPDAAGGQGKLTGVKSGLEYKPVTAQSWITINDSTDISLAAGTYQVRVAADSAKSILASEAVTITIPAAIGVKNAEIQGSTYVGKTLTAVANADATASTDKPLHYEWKAYDTATDAAGTVVGSDSKTLTLTDNEVGKTIKVKIYNYNGTNDGMVDKSKQDYAESKATGKVTVDKSALKKLIDKASEVQKGVTVYADTYTAATVPVGIVFVLQGESDALTGAVTAATAATAETAKTSEVSKQEGDLRSAIDTYVGKKKVGTYDAVNELQTALGNLITAAKKIQPNGETDENGTSTTGDANIIIASDAKAVAPAKQWVTSAAATEFAGKIQTASGTASSDVSATLGEAITALNNAITAYNKAIQKGAALDSSALLAAVNAAELNAASVVTNDTDNKALVLPSKTWVAQTALSTYNSAITAAKTAANTASATTTQSSYDSALNTLNSATDTFNSEKAAGTADIIAPAVTGVLATLDGTTASVSFTTNEAGSYSYTVSGTEAGATGSGTIKTAGAVTFTATYAEGSTGIILTVEDASKNATKVTIVPSTNPAAKIGETGYTTLAAAVTAAATEGQTTITLQKDVKLSNSIIIDKNIILDLNGKTITDKSWAGKSPTKQAFLYVKSDGTLTLNDTVGTGKIEANNEMILAGIIVTIKNNNDETKTAKLIVNGGSIKGQKYAISTNGTRHNTDITINGGSFSSFSSTDGISLYHPDKGKLVINGGTFTGYDGLAVKGGSNVEIKGGTFIATGAYFTPEKADGNGSNNVGSALYIEGNYNYGAKVSVTGGEFRTTDPKAPAVRILFNGDPAAVLNISGGTFSSDPGAYVDKGYMSVEENGKWTVKTCTEENAVAKIGSDLYGSVAAAVNAAGSGQTVELLKDASLTSDVTLKGTLSVPAGKTLTIAEGATLTLPAGGSERLLKVAQGAELVINGTLQSGSGFSDMEMLGTMTVNPSAKLRITTPQGQATYFGEGGLAALDEGAKIVSVPNTAGTYEGGYTYTLTGAATANGFAVTGNDKFVVEKDATLTIGTGGITLAGSKGTEQLTIKEGGALAVSTEAYLKTALTYAESGAIIELAGDVSLTENISIDKNLIIRGKTGNEKLTVYDGQNVGNEACRIQITTGNELTLKDLELTGSWAADVAAPMIGLHGTAKLTVDDCKITDTGESYTSAYGLINTMGSKAGAKVIIKDSTISSIIGTDSGSTYYVLGGGGVCELDVTGNDMTLGSWFMFNVQASGKVEKNNFGGQSGMSGRVINSTVLKDLVITDNVFDDSLSGTRFVLAGDYKIENNSFEALGSSYALYICGAPSESGKASIKENTFDLGTKGKGIFLYSEGANTWAPGGDASWITVRNNKFIGSGTYQIRSSGWDGTLDASYNYFGGSAMVTTYKYMDNNVEKEASVGNVTATPYYTKDTMTEADLSPSPVENTDENTEPSEQDIDTDENTKPVDTDKNTDENTEPSTPDSDTGTDEKVDV